MLSYSVMLLVVSDVTPRSGNGQPYLGKKLLIKIISFLEGMMKII